MLFATERSKQFCTTTKEGFRARSKVIDNLVLMDPVPDGAGRRKREQPVGRHMHAVIMPGLLPSGADWPKDIAMLPRSSHVN